MSSSADSVEMTDDRRPETRDSTSVSSGFRLSSFVLRLQPVLLLLAFLALALTYNAVVPLGEGPDEVGHFAYVLFLAREGRLPVQQSDAKSDVPGEGHQPPLAYLLALPTVAWLPADEQQINLTANPHFVWNGGTDSAAFARGSQEWWPWQGTVLAWHLARVVSALCGAVTVYCTWAIAQRLGCSRRTALLAAAFVAFNPQFLFTSGLVTNDALLAALSAGALWVAIARRQKAEGRRQKAEGRVEDGGQIVSTGWQLKRNNTCPLLPSAFCLLPALSLGLLIGLALLTKQSAVLLLVLMPLAAWWRYPWQWRRMLSFVAVCLAVTALVSGWWYWRNAQLYGDPLGLAAFQDTFLTQYWDWRDPAAWGSALVQLHESFWGRFGWMSVSMPGWIYWVIGAIEVAAVVGLIYQSSRKRQMALEHDHLVFAPLLILPALALAWTVSFALTAGLVAWQGRFLFPALPAIAVLLARGLSVEDRRQGDQETKRPGDREIGRAASKGMPQDTGVRSLVLRPPSSVLRPSSFVPLALFTLAVTMPFAVIAPSYVWYTLPQAQALEGSGQPVALRFAESWKRGVELRAWRIDGQAQPGSTVTVTLTWHALEQLPRDWTVFIHLVDARGEIVAENNTEPLDGRFPMRQWTAGDWVRDPHPVVVPPTLEPGTYTLTAGLYDPTRRRQPMQKVWDAQDKAVAPEVVLGEIRVVKRET